MLSGKHCKAFEEFKGNKRDFCRKQLLFICMTWNLCKPMKSLVVILDGNGCKLCFTARWSQIWQATRVNLSYGRKQKLKLKLVLSELQITYFPVLHHGLCRARLQMDSIYEETDTVLFFSSFNQIHVMHCM